MKKAEKEKGAKDIFFSHDANSASDPKIQKLIFRYGFRGYGWFWRLCEAMRREEEQEYSLEGDLASERPESIQTLYAIAFMLSSPNDQIEISEIRAFLIDCCDPKKFDLFRNEGGRIWSESLRRRMRKMESTRIGKSKGGKNSASSRFGDQSDTEEAETYFEDTSKNVEANFGKRKRKLKLKPKQKIDLSCIDEKFEEEVFSISDPKKRAELIFGGIESIVSHPASIDPDIQKFWIDFMKLRKIKKWIVTRNAATDLWNDLWKLSGKNIELACKIIRQSEVKPWRGFFPLQSNIQINLTKANGSIEQRYKALEEQIRGES